MKQQQIYEMRRIFTVIHGAWCTITNFSGGSSIKMKSTAVMAGNDTF